MSNMLDIKTSSSIAFFTFIPWFIILLLLDKTTSLTNEWTTLFQYALILVLIGFSFSVYFKSQKKIESYETALVSGIWVLLFELVIYLMHPLHQTYNFMNWIMPLFLTISIIYGAGVFFRNKKTRR